MRPIVLTMFLGALGGCAASEDPKLAALKDEPIAELALPQARLAFEHESEEHTALGKPSPAKMTRVFAYDTAEDAYAGRTRAIDTALSSGWRMNLDVDHPDDPVFGTKTLATGEAMLSIGDYADENGFKVSIRLEHRSCPASLCEQP